MIIVTGGAGFVGSNIAYAINANGYDDILVVDHLQNGQKFKNLVDVKIADYMDRDEFLKLVQGGHDFGNVEAVFHNGACSATTEWDGRYMLENNFTYSKTLLHYCLARKIPYIYASSGAVYGHTDIFIEDPQYEKPLNVYGYSKVLFDNYVRRLGETKSQVVGLRYFNVYGPRESHKGPMASVAYHLYNQLKTGHEARLFDGSDCYEAGEQRRDFVHVYDVAKVNLWFLENPDVSGIFNVGTGRAQTFNELANAVIAAMHKGEIVYVPFPEHLKGHYQSFTQADLSKLRAAKFDGSFMTVEDGVLQYMLWLKENE